MESRKRQKAGCGDESVIKQHLGHTLTRDRPPGMLEPDRVIRWSSQQLTASYLRGEEEPLLPRGEKSHT